MAMVAIWAVAIGNHLWREVPLIQPLVQRLRRAGLREQIRRAVDAGVGVYNRTWPLHQAENSSKDALAPQGKARVLCSQVLDWCRFAMGHMRKPYGLDYVSLLVAIIDAEGREVAQVNLGIARPQEFYGDGAVSQRVEEVLVRWEEEELLSPQGGAGPPRLVALLFSWGDLTRELLLAG